MVGDPIDAMGDSAEDARQLERSAVKDARGCIFGVASSLIARLQYRQSAMYVSVCAYSSMELRASAPS